MNDTRPQRRFWSTAGFILIIAATLVGCLVLAGYLYLPTLVSRQLPVAQIRRLGFADFSGRVSKIGLYQTVAGPFVFGPADRPALAVGSLALDYSPKELRRKTIRRIRIRDVVVNAVLGPEGLSFPGLDSSAAAKNATAGHLSAGGPSPLTAITLKTLDIRNGFINLTWNDQTYKIPFDAELTTGGTEMTRLDARVRLFPRDQLLVVSARVDLNKLNGRIHVDGAAIDMDRFADLVHLVPGLNATGTVGVQAGARLALAPVALSDTAIDLTWISGGLTYGSVLVGPEQGGAPAVLAARTGALKTWQIEAAGFQLQAPAPVALNRLAATVDLEVGRQTAAGDAELTILPFSLDRPVPVALPAGVPLSLTFTATQKPSGDWTAGFKTADNRRGAPPEPLALAVAGVDIHSVPPLFSVTATGDGRTGAASWQLDLETVRAAGGGAIVNLPSVEAAGTFQVGGVNTVPDWSGDARIAVPGPALAASGMSGQLDTLTVTARLQGQGNGPPAVDARVQVENGRLHHGPSGLILSGCSLELPYCSDPGKAVRPGTFSVARVVRNKQSLGKIRGQVSPKKDAYAITAAHVSDLFPGMTATLAGTVRTGGADFPRAELTLTMPPYDLPADSDLGRFLPAARGVGVSGTVSARGEASISRQGMNGALELDVAGGVVRMAEKKIVAEGIDATLRFPELPRVRSGPAQRIRFARAAMGGIVVDGGTVDVQVESQKTLFVEKGRLSWCGGTVDAGSLRITAGRQDYQVNLYCQRLGLSRILEQLGSVNARGSGTVNGRIPIAYSAGQIRFDDGFLFSTPGEGGQIHLSGTEILTRGIPAGTPQFVQVELAREALKNYRYTWAKLGLVSEGEDFVMRLQFDGKPVNPLPFVYKKEIGSFVRVEAGAQGSVFQGIGLDVNLRLPLNQLLQYKDIVNMIE
jgi:hypothetical protein